MSSNPVRRCGLRNCNNVCGVHMSAPRRLQPSSAQLAFTHSVHGETENAENDQSRGSQTHSYILIALRHQ